MKPLHPMATQPHISFHIPSLFHFLQSKYNSLMLPYLAIYLFIVCILHQNVKTMNTATLSIMLTTLLHLEQTLEHNWCLVNMFSVILGGRRF